MKILIWLGSRIRQAMGIFTVLVLTTVGLTACGGGGGNSEATPGSNGEVAIALTDAPGDFSAYSVDVLSITLTQANGSVVEVLPVSTRIDFAQLTELTEFVTIATIPAGSYTGARLRLDYTNAEIMVEDDNGNAVAAVARDAVGNPVGTLNLDVRFDRQRPLTIVAGVPAHLTLDFNLAASNQVDVAVTPPVVTVLPFLVADINPEWHKSHRVRGPLVNVDVANSRFTLGIRPLAMRDGDLGRLTVTTDANTQYEIDQVGYQGAGGLNALSLKPSGTATVAFGAVDPATRRFLASEVYAGSSVPYGTSDVVTGSVIARSGDTLTLRGASLERTDGTFTFQETMTVLLADTTKITRQLAPGQSFTKNDISIGQRLFAFGTLSGAIGSQTLDASNGLARMLISSVTATVNNLGGGEIELALQTINGRRVALYNFAGTGTDAANDADPAHYQVSSGALSLTGIDVGTPVRVRGFIRPFGMAPADFEAQTVIDVTLAPAAMAVVWTPASSTPFSGIDATGLTLDLNSSPTVHHVLRGGVLTDLVASNPRVVPLDPSRGLYALGIAGTVTVYTNFDLYQQALAVELANSRTVRGFGGYGSYTDASTSFTGRHLFTAFE